MHLPLWKSTNSSQCEGCIHNPCLLNATCIDAFRVLEAELEIWGNLLWALRRSKPQDQKTSQGSGRRGLDFSTKVSRSSSRESESWWKAKSFQSHNSHGSGGKWRTSEGPASNWGRLQEGRCPTTQRALKGACLASVDRHSFTRIITASLHQNTLQINCRMDMSPPWRPWGLECCCLKGSCFHALPPHGWRPILTIARGKLLFSKLLPEFVMSDPVRHDIELHSYLGKNYAFAQLTFHSKCINSSHNPGHNFLNS